MEKINILAVLGVSGSGKTELVKKLSSINENILKKYKVKKFSNLKQVTTRPRRKNESLDAYKFLTEKEYDGYDKLRRLTAKTKVGDYRYGTLIDVRVLEELYDLENTIFTVVVNATGYDSLKQLKNVNIKALRVIPFGNIPYVKRKNRNYKKISEESLELSQFKEAYEFNNYIETNSIKIGLLKAQSDKKEEEIVTFESNEKLYRFKNSYDIIKELGEIDNDWGEFITIKTSKKK